VVMPTVAAMAIMAITRRFFFFSISSSPPFL
jgi:hypothetical protein